MMSRDDVGTWVSLGDGGGLVQAGGAIGSDVLVLVRATDNTS